MDLKSIFKQDVERAIEGVIKADDEASLFVELDEYVLTNEVAKRLDNFLEAYTNYTGANGVWVSGFFGSGKSHLLKLLALILENRSVDGQHAADIFFPKIPLDDKILQAKFKKAVAIPSRSILFNIDQKADIISKTQVDALLSVFVKVFNEMCGYFGKVPHIAQFERELDSRGQLQTFKDAYRRIGNKEWERGREQALLESANIAKAYAEASGTDAEHAKGILDKYSKQFTLSIEDFGNQVNEWLDKQPANFRLNFFVDEVGQYVAENTKLMTNLQTVAESLATKCRGRAWVIVTAQEDMSDVLGDMTRQQSNDFSKIQARFANRLKLTSTDVAEVIQKRLLTKNTDGEQLLKTIYDQQNNNFKTLFDFSDDTKNLGNFKTLSHFTYCYPFVPYQFPLFQVAIRGISMHNGFEGKANSVGERSMLGVFREVAIAIQHEPVGQLATFDRMFEGIRGALKSGLQSAINTAESHLNDDYAVRVLKALFLVKYVKEFKASLRNLSVLMTERFGEDAATQRNKLQAALNLLEQQTYIQRNGDVYEFLTDEEKDVEQEIKNTDVENSDISKQLEELLFDGVIRQRKIRYDNGQDYAYTRKLDDRALSRESELAIHIVSPLSDNFENLQIQGMQSMGKDELRVVLPADSRFMQDLSMYKRTEKYIRQNSSTPQENIKRILDTKALQNNERLAELQERAKQLLGQAAMIINASPVQASATDGQTRIIKGFSQLIATTYPNLRMLRDTPFTEADIGGYLRKADDGLLGSDANRMTEAEQELLSFIQSNARGGVRTTVKALLERFERKSYGWYFAAILCNLALLCGRGKLEVRQDSNVLEGDALERSLRNTNIHNSMLLTPQVEYTASQVRQLKDFFAEFIDRPATANEAKALARETLDAVKDLERTLAELTAQKAMYPFLSALDGAVAQLKEMTAKPTDWFLIDLSRIADGLLDIKEKSIDPVLSFMQGSQKAIYDQARQLVQEQEDNFSYVSSPAIEAVTALLSDPKPWQGTRLQQTKPQLEALQQAIDEKVAQVRTTAVDTLSQLSQRLKGVDGYAQLKPDQKDELEKPFVQAHDALARQKRIAMIRDQVRVFEDQKYPQLLTQLERLLQPVVAPVPLPTPGTGSDGGLSFPPNTPTPPPMARETTIVHRNAVRVAFARPWLATEADVDEYLASLREALIKEIEASRRVQI
ncbi:MAG: BREX system P-loop protein BrxC [Betaproteobacteria bacterium]